MISIEKLIEGMIQPSIKSVKEDIYILKEGIEDVRKYFPKIPADKFEELIKLDPTYQGGEQLGKFGKWILGLYNKGKLKEEDFYKVPQYLTIFKDNISKIANKDIMTYKSLPDLANVIQGFEGQKDVSKKQQIRDIKKGAKKVLENNNWLVIIPETQEAACYYGANTKWCTAAKEDNYFEYYNERGPLYIFINKQDGKKYQFHAESLSFMNELDKRVAPAKILDKQCLTLLDEAIIDQTEEGNIDYSDILYGLNSNEDGLPIIVQSVNNFLSTIYNWNTDADKCMFYILETYLENCDFTDEIPSEYMLDKTEQMMEYLSNTHNKEFTNLINNWHYVRAYVELNEKYTKMYRDLMKEIKRKIIDQLNEASSKIGEFEFVDINYSSDYNELWIDVNYISGNQSEYYTDIVLDWFINNDRDLFRDDLFEDIANNILTPGSNLTDITDIYVEGLDEILEALNLDGKLNQIKNPSTKDLQEMLKQGDIAFSYNPLKDDLIIFKDTKSLMESDRNINGILSPNLIEVKSDDKEYTKKILRNKFSKVFPNGYQIIIY